MDTRIRAGIGGWNYAPWRNHFYPAKWPQKRELEFASRQLSTIEINSTYYSPQKAPTYARWRSETPDDFVFSLKAPRYCTDRRVLAEAGKAIDDFVFGGLAEFGDRLGPINWQLPPYKAFDRADLAAFIDLLPRVLDGLPLRHVLEVRHASFLCEEYVELARKQRIATVYTDSPKYPSLADVTGDFVYARLMRSESQIDTGYAAIDLDAWAQRARIWSGGADPTDLPRVADSATSNAPRDVFIYFISAAKERNPAAAKALSERIGR